MRRILATVGCRRPSTIPVLITGESGTGKELIARAVHRNSPCGKVRAAGGLSPSTARARARRCAGMLFGQSAALHRRAEKDREGVRVRQQRARGIGGTLFSTRSAHADDDAGCDPRARNAEIMRLGSKRPAQGRRALP